MKIDDLNWKVQAGDQKGHSEDDKECGDHFIAKDKECHDGDAHRPDPGNNPYWQGGRKGPPGEDAGGKGKSEDGSRDRREVTKKAKKKEEGREAAGEGFTPERAASFATDTLNDKFDQAEEAYGPDLDWNSEHGQKLAHELAEETIRDTAKEYAGQMDQRAEKKYLPGRDHEDTRPAPGVGPRQMYRPGPGDKSITFDAPEHGTPVRVPKAPGMGVFRDLIDKTLQGRGKGKEEQPRRKEAIEHTKQKKEGGPSKEQKDEQSKWDAPDFAGEDAPPSKTKKGDVGPYEYQERQVDEWDPEQGEEESKPYRQKERRRQTQKDYKRKKDAKKGKKSESSLALSLNWDDQANARPCEDGEDPKVGKCNPETTPERTGRKSEQPAGPTTDQYRMSDSPKQFKGKPDPNQGITPQDDSGRKSRIAQSVKSLTADKGDNPAQTGVAMRHMFGGNPTRPSKDGGITGGQVHSTPEEAKAAGDDAKVALEQGGWTQAYDMGGTAQYQKGSTKVTIQTSEQNGKYGNKFKVSAPQPQKKGWFGRKG